MRVLSLLLACLMLFGGAARAALPTPPLVPARHGDFDHYTFALSWQPGWCATESGCEANQPHDQLIGIHGLWAGLPQSLMERGISRPQWWAKGCDEFEPSRARPTLPPSLRHQLADVLPHTKGDLLRHEYDKHVQCFGFDPVLFFRTELAMRDAVLANGFARDLQAQAGRTVAKEDLAASFARFFRTSLPRAVQFQCGQDGSGRTVLTQFWISIRSDALSRFPDPRALTNSPVPQDNCPAWFGLPAW